MTPKPCPFCGDTTILRIYNPARKTAHLMCGHCGATSVMCICEESSKDTILDTLTIKWNERREIKSDAASRREVYDALDSELLYQVIKFGDNPHEIDAFATYIRQYSTTLDAVCTHASSDQKLEFIRKIGALCVRCMEQHGAPLREFPAEPAPEAEVDDQIEENSPGVIEEFPVVIQ